MITRLTIQNIKETLCEVVKLAQHNVVLGGWGSGKTTIADALQVAINGKPISDLYTGAGNAVVFDALCTGGKDTMGVALTSSAISFERRYVKNGSIRQEIDIPGGPDGVTKCEAEITAKLGRAIFDVRVLRDDPDTVKRTLLKHCAGDAAGVRMKVAVAIARALTNAFIKENWLDLYAEFNGFSLDMATPEQQQKAVDAAREKLDEAGVAAAPFLPADIVARSGGGDIVDTMDKIAESIGIMSDKRKEATREAQAAKKAIKAMGDDIATRAIPAKQLQDVREQLRQHEQDLSGQMRRKSEADGYVRAMQSMRAERDRAAHRLDEIVTREIPQHDELVRQTRDEEQHARYTEADHEQALVIVSTADTILKKSGLCVDCMVKVCEYLEKKKALAARIRKALDRKGPLLDSTAMANLRKRLDDEAAALGNRMAEIDATLNANAPEVPECDALIAGLQSAIESDKKTIDELVAHKTRQEQYQMQQLALQRAEKAALMYETVEASLKASYDQQVLSAFAPVTESVNEALRVISPGWCFYIELDSRGRLVFGVDKPVKGQQDARCKTPYRSLSGAESVFVRNVLGAVLLKLNDSAEKILVDEIAEMPVDIAGQFLGAMRWVTGHQVQCLFMTCHDIAIPEGWNVIERGQTTADVVSKQQKAA